MRWGKKAQLDEFNPEALVIGGIIWLLFVVMVLKVPTWGAMKMGWKVVMLIIALPLFYAVANYRINK